MDGYLYMCVYFLSCKDLPFKDLVLALAKIDIHHGHFSLQACVHAGSSMSKLTAIVINHG